MTRPMSFAKLSVAAALALVCLAATAQAAADPNGTWKWKFTTQNGQDFELAVTLKAEGEKLTGSLTLPMGDNIDIADGSFKDDEVSFTTAVERNGNKFTTKYKGKVNGDTIKGKTERERDGEKFTRDWEAKREKIQRRGTTDHQRVLRFTRRRKPCRYEAFRWSPQSRPACCMVPPRTAPI